MSISSQISTLKEKMCWSVIAGSGTGSVVSLGFGEKQAREKVLTNPVLSEDEKIFAPEIELMIHCAWRLTKSNRVLCGWRDSNELEGEMLKGLALVRYKKVINIDFNLFTYDFNIEFEGNINLQVFCDQTNDFDSDENYTLFINNTAYTVGLKNELEIDVNGVAHH